MWLSQQKNRGSEPQPEGRSLESYPGYQLIFLDERNLTKHRIVQPSSVVLAISQGDEPKHMISPLKGEIAGIKYCKGNRSPNYRRY